MDPHRPKHIANEQFVIDMFKYMDKNQDGFVSKAEIKTYADKYGATLLGPKGQALFDKIDASDDEKISMEGKKLNSFFDRDIATLSRSYKWLFVVLTLCISAHTSLA